MLIGPSRTHSRYRCCALPWNLPSKPITGYKYSSTGLRLYCLVANGSPALLDRSLAQPESLAAFLADEGVQR